MAIAGVDKWLTSAEIEVICQHYTAPKTASMDVMHYAQFLADVDEIFTKPVSDCCCETSVFQCTTRRQVQPCQHSTRREVQVAILHGHSLCHS
jgi:hypothetical protein